MDDLSSMAMDDEQLLQEFRWNFQLKRGEELTLIPWDDEPFLVTSAFLVDPESAAGQGVVDAYVEMGERKIMLAQLTSEVTDVQLEYPVLLDEEFRFYIMRPEGEADVDTDEDTVFVQLKGFVLPDEDEELEEEDGTSSDDDKDDSVEDDESEGEDDQEVAMESTLGELQLDS